jgi:hypothetical protein
MDELFTKVIYNLYEEFYKNLNQEEIVRLVFSSKQIYFLSLSSGGFAKSVQFNYKVNIKQFNNILLNHNLLNKIYFDGSGTSFSVFDILPVSSYMNVSIPRITTWVLINPVDDKFEIKNRSKKYISIKYLFIKTDVVREFKLNIQTFPNLEFIGVHNCNIEFTNIDDELVNEIDENKIPSVMDFRDSHSLNLMSSKNTKVLGKIVKQIKKIFK